ncbi:MAG: hypothetical protein HY855_25075 [Burkholderiales bacterium]|nr:hypothetical protein [Burkholderiales bacterium]
MLPESLNDAYIEAVKALGGSKVVGVALWPAKGVEAAQRHLLACLNPDRNEKLSPEEALHIERLCRERGIHTVMQYRAATLGYSEPVPTDPKDELAELLRASIEANRETQRRQERIERLLEQHSRPRAVA